MCLGSDGNIYHFGIIDFLQKYVITYISVPAHVIDVIICCD